MKKNFLTILIIVTFISIFYFITSKKPASVSPTPASDLVLFYGSTCPHCKVVEEFITTNQIDQKIKIDKLEVYENQSNATTFSNMVKEVCPDQLKAEGLPVPFLIDQKDKKCTIGDTPITDYLTEKTK